MTAVFLSYGRANQDKVRALAQDLESLGHQVWYDQALTGGQAWWDQVLAKIRECGVFVFALTPESLESNACRLEYSYADDLDKIVLPILVAEGVATELLPTALAKLQFVDYRAQDKSALMALVRAFNALPPARALPTPLPPPPAAPLSYLSSLTQDIDSEKQLSFQEQSALLVRLKQGLKEPRDAQNVRALLKRFRARDDLLAKVSVEIDELLAGEEAPVTRAPAAGPLVAGDRPLPQRVGAVHGDRGEAIADADVQTHEHLHSDMAGRGTAYEIGLALGSLMKYFGMVLAGGVAGFFVPALFLDALSRSDRVFPVCMVIMLFAGVLPVVIAQRFLLRRGGRQKLAKRWSWLVPLGWVIGGLFGDGYDRAVMVPLYGALGGAVVAMALMLHEYFSTRSKTGGLGPSARI